MAIKYIQIPEKKMTIAILEDCRYDAVVKIAKILDSTSSLRFNPEKYLMSNSFKAIAKCAPDDVWDEDVGKAVAKAKVMKKYYKSYDKRLDAFVDELNEVMFEATQRIGS